MDAGDEVIIPTPFWVTYEALVQLALGVPRRLKTSINDEYKITPAALESAITPKTKLFIFSSPCNPSGSVYSKKELEALAAVFEKHPQVLIISDEIYEYVNYTEEGHSSIAPITTSPRRIVWTSGVNPPWKYPRNFCAAVSTAGVLTPSRLSI